MIEIQEQKVVNNLIGREELFEFHTAWHDETDAKRVNKL